MLVVAKHRFTFLCDYLIQESKNHEQCNKGWKFYCILLNIQLNYSTFPFSNSLDIDSLSCGLDPEFHIFNSCGLTFKFLFS